MGPLFSIECKLTAAVQFTGATPTGDLTEPTLAQATAHELWAYAALTAASANAVAGLFNPAANGTTVVRGWRVKRIALKLGGQSVWRFDLIDQASVVAVTGIITGTTETAFVTERYDEILLLPGEKLALYTTGMTAAATARVTFERA